MTKLTDLQRRVLSKAAARDGAALAPTKMNKAAATRLAASLVARKLMREIRSKSDMPVWREDGDGRSFSLVITGAGRKAMGREGERSSSTIARSASAIADRKPQARKQGSVEKDLSAERDSNPRQPYRTLLSSRELETGAGDRHAGEE